MSKENIFDGLPLDKDGLPLTLKSMGCRHSTEDEWNKLKESWPSMAEHMDLVEKLTEAAKGDYNKMELEIGDIEIAKNEMVNHPNHYGGADNPYEAIKVIEAWDADFNIGTVLRYLCRAGKKTIGGDSEAMRLEDLKKARWYLDREISNIEKN